MKLGRTGWYWSGKKIHGIEIPREYLEAERGVQTEGMIVVAVKKRTIMDVFAAPAGQIVEASEKKPGRFDFNCKENGNCLIVKEIPGMTLNKIATIPYGKEEMEGDKRIREFKRIIRGALTKS